MQILSIQDDDSEFYSPCSTDCKFITHILFISCSVFYFSALKNTWHLVNSSTYAE